MTVDIDYSLNFFSAILFGMRGRYMSKSGKFQTQRDLASSQFYLKMSWRR